MGTRTITVTEEDIAALVAVRGVIGDAARHPGRDAAIAAIDRIAAAPAATVIAVRADGAQVTDCFRPSPAANGAIRQMHDAGSMYFGAQQIRPVDAICAPYGFDAICALYGFDSLKVFDAIIVERAYHLRAERRGRSKSVLVSQLDIELSPMSSAPWFEAIRRLALDLGVDDIGAKDQQLVEILTGSMGRRAVAE